MRDDGREIGSGAAARIMFRSQVHAKYAEISGLCPDSVGTACQPSMKPLPPSSWSAECWGLSLEVWSAGGDHLACQKECSPPRRRCPRPKGTGLVAGCSNAGPERWGSPVWARTRDSRVSLSLYVASATSIKGVISRTYILNKKLGRYESGHAQREVQVEVVQRSHEVNKRPSEAVKKLRGGRESGRRTGCQLSGEAWPNC